MLVSRKFGYKSQYETKNTSSDYLSEKMNLSEHRILIFSFVSVVAILLALIAGARVRQRQEINKTEHCYSSIRFKSKKNILITT